ncbi:hypothetical protein [Natronosalvus amylolyticus]|uniref:hypothetical protein n=1 Tax=Natronosalvus amylolyticus TaxID=2961994 RepID=UPI0020C97C39|nr:hypothetical protein [Natronosalvus amylolyticus]
MPGKIFEITLSEIGRIEELDKRVERLEDEIEELRGQLDAENFLSYLFSNTKVRRLARRI